jgi:hypothetical protein
LSTLQLNPRLDQAAFERALASEDMPPIDKGAKQRMSASSRRMRLLGWLRLLSNEPKKLGDLLPKPPAAGMPALQSNGDAMSYDAIVWLMRHDLLVELHS